MELTKEFVNSCRKVGVLRDFLCQAIDQVDEKDKEIATLKDSQRWRKYPDEKPKDGQCVWAYEDKSKRVLMLEYQNDKDGEGFICFPYNCDFYIDITKWIPFNKPKAPEG